MTTPDGGLSNVKSTNWRIEPGNYLSLDQLYDMVRNTHPDATRGNTFIFFDNGAGKAGIIDVIDDVIRMNNGESFAVLVTMR